MIRGKRMTDKPGLEYDTHVASTTTKNYRKVTMSKTYHEQCGSPELDNPLFLKAVFIGYGASAIRLLMAGLDTNVNDVHLTAEFMGYNESQFVVIVKE